MIRRLNALGGAFLLLLLLTASSGCGNKGPLYLPQGEPPVHDTTEPADPLS